MSITLLRETSSLEFHTAIKKDEILTELIRKTPLSSFKAFNRDRR